MTGKSGHCITLNLETKNKGVRTHPTHISETRDEGKVTPFPFKLGTQSEGVVSSPIRKVGYWVSESGDKVNSELD